MTIKEAIDKADTLKPNHYSRADKVGWLSTVEGLIAREIVARHQGGDSAEAFTGYDDSTPDDTELLAGEPFAELYVYWLFAQIDFMNSEINRYNNSMTMFNASYQNFANFYNRNNLPRQDNAVRVVK